MILYSNSRKNLGFHIKKYFENCVKAPLQHIKNKKSTSRVCYSPPMQTRNIIPFDSESRFCLLSNDTKHFVIIWNSFFEFLRTFDVKFPSVRRSTEWNHYYLEGINHHRKIVSCFARDWCRTHDHLYEPQAC